MIKYINQLLLKTESFNENLLSSSLFISFDKVSALRHDYIKVVEKIKIFENFEVLNKDERVLQEGYEQGLYIIEANNIKLFIRLILSDKQIYDVLIYTITDMGLIKRVFFNKEEIIIPELFLNNLNLDKIVLILNKEDSNYKILKANDNFYKSIKYEDWDFNNKYRNIINPKVVGQLANLSSFSMYQSDGQVIEFSFEILNKDNIICLISK